MYIKHSSNFFVSVLFINIIEKYKIEKITDIEKNETKCIELLLQAHILSLFAACATEQNTTRQTS